MVLVDLEIRAGPEILVGSVMLRDLVVQDKEINMNTTAQESRVKARGVIHLNTMILLVNHVTLQPNMILLSNLITIWSMTNHISLLLITMKEIRVGTRCSMILI